MNKKILRQAQLFEKQDPVYSKVRDLCQIASGYQVENEKFFLKGKRGGRAKLGNFEDFFEFLSKTQDVNVKSFQDIEKLLKPNKSRRENIRYTGDSKSHFVRVFDGVVLVKKLGELPRLYQKDDLDSLAEIDQFVAIENAETFLNIEEKSKYFPSRYFVYLSGYANRATRAFLETKSVEFFVDYDIEGMNIYESFICHSKHLHIAEDIEQYFSNSKEIVHNVTLYKKQRVNLKDIYSHDATIVIELIKKYNTTVEQEIIYEAY